MGLEEGPSRRENLSLRLWMAKNTTWSVSIISINGFATPLPNAVRTLPTMESPRMLMPNNASRKPALLLLLFWLKRMRMRNLMRILTATEKVAREDFIPCSYIFSVGHPSQTCSYSSPSSFLYGPGNLLLPSPMSKLCYGSSLLLFLTPCLIPMFSSTSSLLVLSGSNRGSSSPTPPLTTLLSS
jgi:hypothetical protein